MQLWMAVLDKSPHLAEYRKCKFNTTWRAPRKILYIMAGRGLFFLKKKSPNYRKREGTAAFNISSNPSALYIFHLRISWGDEYCKIVLNILKSHSSEKLFLTFFPPSFQRGYCLCFCTIRSQTVRGSSLF